MRIKRTPKCRPKMILPSSQTFEKMPIFIYYFDCILQVSKFISATAFRIVNIYLCLLLGNLHTNKSIVIFSGTCITVNLLDCDA